ALRTVVELVLLTGLLWWSAARVRTYEADVRRHGAQLTAFLDTAAIALHRIGADGNILWANDTELQMLGWDRAEYVGHDIAEFHVDGDAIADVMARLHRGEKVYAHPARMRCKDGSAKDVLIDSSVLWDDGRFVHTQCFTRDVSERDAAERVRAL